MLCWLKLRYKIIYTMFSWRKWKLPEISAAQWKFIVFDKYFIILKMLSYKCWWRGHQKWYYSPESLPSILQGKMGVSPTISGIGKGLFLAVLPSLNFSRYVIVQHYEYSMQAERELKPRDHSNMLVTTEWKQVHVFMLKTRKYNNQGTCIMGTMEKVCIS